MLANLLEQALGPQFGIARRAALDQRQQAGAAEMADAGPRARAARARSAASGDDELLAADHAQFAFELGELVRPHVDAGSGCRPGPAGPSALLHGLEQRLAIEQAGARIAAHGVGEILGHVAASCASASAPSGARRDRHRARPGSAPVPADSVLPSAGQQVGAQRVVVPASLQAGHQRALQRRVVAPPRRNPSRAGRRPLSASGAPMRSSQDWLASTRMPSCTCAIASFERVSTVSSCVR